MDTSNEISVYKYLDNTFFYGNPYKSTYILFETIFLMSLWWYFSIDYLNYFGIISKSVFTILWSLFKII